MTAGIAERALKAYGSPLAGNAQELISAFKIDAWIGLAIMKQECVRKQEQQSHGRRS